jgi:hypothetical protein
VGVRASVAGVKKLDEGYFKRLREG